MKNGWVQVFGRVKKFSASGKAVLFEFTEAVTPTGKKDVWIPKKCFEIEEGFVGKHFVSSWFYRKIVDGTNELGSPKPPTKSELVAKYTRRIEANESFAKIERPVDEPKFFGNVDKVLEKILN